MESNVILNELMQQWEKEAEINSASDTYVAILEEDVYERGYIKGRTDQYLQMQAEIERLKGLIETAWNDGEKAGLHNYFCATHDDMTFEQFKTKHKL